MSSLTKKDIIFPVSMCPMDTTETDDCKSVRVVPNSRAVRRIDTGEVLGVVGSNYRIVPNEDCINNLEAALNQLALPFDTDIYAARDFAELYMRYNLTSVSKQLSTKEDICVSLILVNSYNAWTRVGVELEMKNLTNDSYYNLGQRLVRVSQLHCKSADPQKISEIVSQQVDHFNNEIFPKFEQMAQTVLDVVSGNGIIDQLKEFPEKYRDLVKVQWARNSGTLWKFFSAFAGVISTLDSIKRQRMLNEMAWKTVERLI